MDITSFQASLLVGYFAVAITGGFVAQNKGDFFTRGLAITAITSIFGLAAMLLAPPSKARFGDEHDIKHWHQHGANGGIAMIVVSVLISAYYVIQAISG